ncbi:tyrosine-type recombinase/integrase [Pseudomonas aeruginosa]
MKFDDDLVLRFFDSSRGRDDVYDFGKFKVDSEFVKYLIVAFECLTGHYAARSRRQSWRSITKFLRFIEAQELAGGLKGKGQLLSDFYEYLRRDGSLNKTIGGHYNFIRRILVWLSMNSDSEIFRGQVIGRFTIERESINYRGRDVNLTQLKLISKICKKEVEDIRRRFGARRSLECNEEVAASELSAKEVESLKSLIAAEREGLWTQRDFKGRVLCHAPLRKLSTYRELTYRDALPIFLLILIQTAGNPISIMELSVSCVEDHPFDDSRCVVKWQKGRASREQAKSFLRKGKYGVLELVDLLVNMTEPIRHLCGEADKDLLFITRCGNKAERISIQGIHNALNKFRSDNSIDKFSFSDIRKAVAGALVRSGESIQSVSDLLQHKDKSTTRLYLEGREATEKKFEQLHKYQGEMLKIESVNHSNGDVSGTLLGFDCKDIYSGISSGSCKGEICLEFLNCATCPNALVVIDDANSVSRIIRAQKALIDMREKSVVNSDSNVRFEFIYQPILSVIENEILTRVNKSVLRKAELLSRTLPPLPVIH